MAQELIYTSAPRGLRMGSSGFCTVACSRGMAPNYVEVLESLSGYSAVYPPHDERAALNPPAYSHYRYRIGGKQVYILSRVAFAGLDHTGRSNKFAHHLVLDATERAAGGPAWVLRQDGLLREGWDGGPRYLETLRPIPQGDATPAPCAAWQEQTGEAGWAGVLAQAFLDDPRKPCFIIFEPGIQMLPLVAEALRLIPRERRWDVTFNTYFSALPMGTSCAWRCCLADSPALRHARRMPDALVLDLTAGQQQPERAMARMAAGSALIQCARDGTPPRVEEPEEPVPAETPLRVRAARPRAEAEPAAEPAAEPVRQAEAPLADAIRAVPARRRQVASPLKAVALVLAAFLLLSLAVNGYILLRRSRAPEADLAQAPPPAEPAIEPRPEGPGPEVALEPGFGDDQAAPGEPDQPWDGAPELGEPPRFEPPSPPPPAHNLPPVVFRLSEDSTGVAESLVYGADRQAYPVPLEGVSPDWEVVKVGAWDGLDCGHAAGIRHVPAERGLRLTGTNAGTGQEMTIATVSAADGAVQFLRGDPTDPNAPIVADGQIQDALADAGWVRLAPPGGGDEVHVVLAPIELPVPLERAAAGGNVLVGHLPLRRFIAPLFAERRVSAPDEITDEAQYPARPTMQLDERGDLVLHLAYDYQRPPELLAADKQLDEALASRDRAKDKLRELDAAVEAAERHLREANAPIKHARKNLDEAKHKLKEATEQLGKFTNNATDYIASKPQLKAAGWSDEAIQRDQRELETKVATQHDIVRRKKGQVPDLERALREARDKHEPKLPAARAAVTKAKKEAEPARRDLELAEKALVDVQDRIAELEDRENAKRRDAFGRFIEPLELELDGQVIARLRLEPPSS